MSPKGRRKWIKKLKVPKIICGRVERIIRDVMSERP